LNKKALIKKISVLAQQDKKRRQDPRYLKDALWAGRIVEPRILEVLPAAYERFKKHFSGDADTIAKFEQVIKRIRQKDNKRTRFSILE
jgi:hypothetical protein